MKKSCKTYKTNSPKNMHEIDSEQVLMWAQRVEAQNSFR